MLEGCDMIVGLTHLPSFKAEDTVKIKRAFIADKARILEFVRENFNEGWVYEAEKALLSEVSKCFIAVENNKILGFSCFDSAAKGFFGPIGVSREARGKNVGAVLLIRTLEAMRDYGYGYAIIGWVNGAENFYRKTVGAEFIKNGNPENSVYSNLIAL